jgi:hypothetical protein
MKSSLNGFHKNKTKEKGVVITVKKKENDIVTVESSYNGIGSNKEINDKCPFDKENGLNGINGMRNNKIKIEIYTKDVEAINNDDKEINYDEIINPEKKDS